LTAGPVALDQATGPPPVVAKSRDNIPENIPPIAAIEDPLAKNRKSAQSKGLEFSPIDFSPMPDKHFSPMRRRGLSPAKKADFSPMKKPAKKGRLKAAKESKSGQRGRPRNPDLPPSPAKYFYWTKAGNGLKLEKRKPDYEYIGFIMPKEWLNLRGQYDEEYILKTIIAAIRVKRARAAQSRRPGALTA
jgi:hypothetical protein